MSDILNFPCAPGLQAEFPTQGAQRLSKVAPRLCKYCHGPIRSIKRTAYCSTKCSSAGGGGKNKSKADFMNDIVAEQRENSLWSCAICGLIDNRAAFFDLDHIIPKCRGGTDAAENRQILCPNCHRRKTIRDGTWRGRPPLLAADIAKRVPVLDSTCRPGGEGDALRGINNTVAQSEAGRQSQASSDPRQQIRLGAGTHQAETGY